MSKSQETFSKKEREKKKAKKQQDKADKMKERKHNKEKKSLDDMIAYLDENGNLTSTPPDPRKRKEFNQEDIVIGVPKQVDMPEDALRTGTVAFFNDSKGFGFINDALTRERIFVHVNNLQQAIKENDKVTFEVEKSHKGPVAVNVTVIK
jgi:cold shock CspA family protein